MKLHTFKTKILFLVSMMLTTLFYSCESENDFKSKIDALRVERQAMQISVDNLYKDILEKHKEITDLNEKLKELNIYKSGKTPKYILKINLRQSHFSLSITKHLKDAMNAIDFELPVDKDFYNSVSVGTQIVDNFRTGSLLLHGSIGNWNMRVSGKEIR